MKRRSASIAFVPDVQVEAHAHSIAGSHDIEPSARLVEQSRLQETLPKPWALKLPPSNMILGIQKPKKLFVSWRALPSMPQGIQLLRAAHPMRDTGILEW